MAERDAPAQPALEDDLIAGEPLDLRMLTNADIRETHGSRVFLAGDRAYKLRKAVRFPFLDQRDAAERRRLAFEEVRLGQELAPSTYLGVRSAITDDGPDVVVEMRRFRESDTLAGRLADDRARPGMLESIGERLAAFHAASPPLAGGGAGAALARLHRNSEDLVELVGTQLHASELWSVMRPLEAYLLRQQDVFHERASAGAWREGHGDLRADHIVIDELGLQMVDRLEFDRSLRIDDVSADLAFLVADLEARGFGWAAQVVVGAYRDAGGDPGDDAMLAFWSAYRVTVSLKVALLRGVQPGGERALEQVGPLMALAEQLAWRVRDPRIFVLCGPPASGKSTFARALERRTGLPVLSSDVVRKQSLALSRKQHAPNEAYTDEVSMAVYRTLGTRAAAELQTHSGAIVDATMGRSALRASFTDALDGAGPTLYVECRAPDAELDHRARLRMDDPSTDSDATPEVARALRDAFEPLDEIDPHHHLLIRADQPASAFLEDLESRLDALEHRASDVERGFDALEARVVERGRT